MVAALSELELQVRQDVQTALAEDLAAGDLLADLVPADKNVQATILARSSGVLAGFPWVEATLAATCAGGEHRCTWTLAEGESFAADTELAQLTGSYTGILTAERVLLNFLGLMCGIATAAKEIVTAATPVPVFDTRKTLPKLRFLQKYAVTVGGMANNRANLHEAIIIKDNHIAAAGSIAAAYKFACHQCAKELIQVEVADEAQLKEALAIGISRIMLDNFSPDEAKAAVDICAGRDIELEVSGNITAATAASYADTGISRLSCGAVTKNVTAVDLSLNIVA